MNWKKNKPKSFYTKNLFFNIIYKERLKVNNIVNMRLKNISM